MDKLLEVEERLTAALERARQAGLRFRQGAFGLDCDPQGKYGPLEDKRICLISTLLVGEAYEGDLGFVGHAARLLGLTIDEVWQLVDGWDERSSDDKDAPLYQLGERLRRRFWLDIAP